MAKELPKCGACNVNPGIYVQELESGEKIMICDECQNRDIEANRRLFLKQKMEQGYEPEGLTKLDAICFNCGRKISFWTEGKNRGQRPGDEIKICCVECGNKRNRFNNSY